MSFVIIIGANEEAKAHPSWAELEEGDFAQGEPLLVPIFEHGYFAGEQHIAKERRLLATCDSAVFFWQNERGPSQRSAALSPLPPAPRLLVRNTSNTAPCSPPTPLPAPRAPWRRPQEVEADGGEDRAPARCLQGHERREARRRQGDEEHGAQDLQAPVAPPGSRGQVREAAEGPAGAAEVRGGRPRRRLLRQGALRCLGRLVDWNSALRRFSQE